MKVGGLKDPHCRFCYCWTHFLYPAHSPHFFEEGPCCLPGMMRPKAIVVEEGRLAVVRSIVYCSRVGAWIRF